MLYARSRVVHAAARHGLDVIDVPWLDLADEPGLLEECRLVQALGFTGKAAIHPKQLPVINGVFTPDPARIAYAKKVIAAFEAAPDGLVVVDGKLIEIPIVRIARRTLAVADSDRSGMRAEAMVADAVKVGEKRYRESYGRYFEDFSVGDVYEHRPGRTITEADNTWFTLLTMNQHPLHFDREYARHTEFGQPIVNSALTLAVVTGMSVSDVSQKAIANLGWTDIVDAGAGL